MAWLKIHVCQEIHGLVEESCLPREPWLGWRIMSTKRTMAWLKNLSAERTIAWLKNHVCRENHGLVAESCLPRGTMAWLKNHVWQKEPWLSWRIMSANRNHGLVEESCLPRGTIAWLKNHVCQEEPWLGWRIMSAKRNMAWLKNHVYQENHGLVEESCLPREPWLGCRIMSVKRNHGLVEESCLPRGTMAWLKNHVWQEEPWLGWKIMPAKGNHGLVEESCLVLGTMVGLRNPAGLTSRICCWGTVSGLNNTPTANLLMKFIADEGYSKLSCGWELRYQYFWRSGINKEYVVSRLSYILQCCNCTLYSYISCPQQCRWEQPSLLKWRGYGLKEGVSL